MKCHACGHDNADSALFCSACRRPLVAPSAVPKRLEPLAQPAMRPAAPAMGAPAGRSTPENRFAPPETGVHSRAADDTGVMTDEEARAAFIGDSSTVYYMDRFDRLSNGQSGGFHWPALFVTWYWMLYRKMWVPALIYFFAPYLIGLVLGGMAAVSPVLGAILYLAWIVIWLVGPGFLANGWYYKHAMAKIRDVRARGGSKDQMLARVEAAGGTSSILIIILAIFSLVAGIGILAAVALPAYQTYTYKAKAADAISEGNEVAQGVGKQYEQTGQLPADIGPLVAQAHQSPYVRKIELDDTSGTLVLHVELGPRVAGTIQLVPGADNNRHMTWTCTTEDMKKYVPASCRN